MDEQTLFSGKQGELFGDNIDKLGAYFNQGEQNNYLDTNPIIIRRFFLYFVYYHFWIYWDVSNH